MSDGNEMHPEQMRVWESIYSLLAGEDREGYGKVVEIFWDGRTGQLLPGEYEYRAESIIQVAAEVLAE